MEFNVVFAVIGTFLLVYGIPRTIDESALSDYH
jgi:hypothetical protein